MQTRPYLPWLVALIGLLAWVWGGDWGDARVPRAGAPENFEVAFASRPRGREALLPLPPPPPLPAAEVALGQRLFFDKRLSRGDLQACASCHDLAHGGIDGRRFAVGVAGQTGPVNTPTVFNASLSLAQFWDGRADSLEAQAAGPVHNPLEMASNWDEVIAKLIRDDGYVRAFRQIYGRDIDAAAIVRAIAAFERTLLTPDSRFDRFLRGETDALNRQEQAGYRRFLDYGCVSCHQGVGIGGNLYQKFGVMDDYFADRPPTPADLGRFNVTGRTDDRHVFKVPGLRNVAATPPYFHDASAATLEEAIVIMARYQLGRHLAVGEVAELAAFLRSLTGQWAGQVLQ